MAQPAPTVGQEISPKKARRGAVQSAPAPADTHLVNIYDVSHVNGDVYEIEADFYEREGTTGRSNAPGSRSSE